MSFADSVRVRRQNAQVARVSSASASLRTPAVNAARLARVNAAPTVTMMAKKSVGTMKEADLKGKKVLIRCDLNVPLDGKTITDDTRIRASVETIKYLVDNGARVAVREPLGSTLSDRHNVPVSVRSRRGHRYSAKPSVFFMPACTRAEVSLGLKSRGEHPD